jgi:hypothetical protein
MPKRKRASDENKLKSGRGQGHGSDYKPFLTVRDFGSIGLSIRIKDWHSERIHHFLSSLEVAYYYVLIWSLAVQDIREQFPLPLDETLAIAKRLNIPHPQKNMPPSVMTTDFLLDVLVNGRPLLLARTTKYSCDLDDFRTMEKFEIERTLWKEKNTEWGITTELDIPKGLAQNIRWLYPSIYIEDLPQIDVKDIDYYENKLHRILHSYQSSPLKDVCKTTDRQLGLIPGTSLSVAKYLIATRRWKVDMMNPIAPWKPLTLLSREKEQILELVNA